MSPKDFVNEWSTKKDSDGSPSVGIGVNWHKVDLSISVVQQYSGNKAWKQVENYYAPIWGGFNRTKMKDWLNLKRPDYSRFIKEEDSVGKIDLYRKNGLIYPELCAISDINTDIGVMADGCHRFIDCNFLILSEGFDLNEMVSKCRLDVLSVNNLLDVINPSDYPPEFVLN